MSFVITTLAIWGMSGQLTLAASIGLAEMLIKSFGYYMHECVWEWVDLRKISPWIFFVWVRQRVGWFAEVPNAIQPEEAIV
jgi:uncharacterized membrane protein